MRLLDQAREPVLSLFRLIVGALFVCHGAASLFGVLGSKGAVAFPVWPSWWAAAIQLVGGALVALGLFTRIAALICSGSMAYAYFTAHAPKGFFPLLNQGELSVLFCWAFLLIVVIGPGAWSVDRLLRRATANSSRPAVGVAVTE
ncbi:DoxX family protein [Kutzneria viridogrisea]|uniref:Oxidoreductase n=1 Tax=Kutzneria viridogrisea TaxID=47990 RepID=A0ABR6BEH6_9PSEU|nr:putative oxidoreductase [Kutzneria viridogrisea]